MNEELRKRYETAIEETLGPEGRMISLSKSGYAARFPERVAIYNAVVCIKGGEVWYGDLDLTFDEVRLAALARKIGQPVYVRSEHHARFEHEDDPRRKRSLFSITESGHSAFAFASIERSRDGRLLLRQPTRAQRRRLVLPGRPRLWRFWRIERERRTLRGDWGIEYAFKLFSGIRGKGRHEYSPLAVFIYVRGYSQGVRERPRERWGYLEWTFYPSGSRSAPRRLFDWSGRLRLGPIRAYAGLTGHLGVAWTAIVSIELGRGHK